MSDGQSLGSDGGGDDWHSLSQGFENLDSGSASGSEGHDEKLAGVEMGADIVHRASHFDAGIFLGQSTHSEGGVATDDSKTGLGMSGSDCGKNVAGEVLDTLDVRHPVHGTEKPDEVRFRHALAGRMKEIGINSRWHCAEDIDQSVFVAAEFGVFRGYGNHAIELRGEVAFCFPHPTELLIEIPTRNRVRLLLGESFPDLRFDVVLEQQGRGLSGLVLKMNGRCQEVADDEIEYSRLIEFGDLLLDLPVSIAIQHEGQGGRDEVSEDLEKKAEAAFLGLVGRNPDFLVSVGI